MPDDERLVETAERAWYYPTPTSAASAIAGRVAFWHGVKIDDGGRG